MSNTTDDADELHFVFFFAPNVLLDPREGHETFLRAFKGNIEDFLIFSANFRRIIITLYLEKFEEKYFIILCFSFIPGIDIIRNNNVTTTSGQET